jgi:3-isopropylmalate dehydrogenase
VAKRFPAVAMNDLHVDACASLLVLRPQEFDVIVTTNMFGDILSNEAASLVGGLGLAPGLNVGESHAMAQAAHGSAPDIEDLHVANPIAEVLSGKMLLSWFAERLDLPALDLAAEDIERAIRMTVEDGRTLTPDLGGRATTAAFTEAVLAAV